MLKSIDRGVEIVGDSRKSLNALNAVTEPTDAQKTEERDLTCVTENNRGRNTEAALTDESEAETHPTAPPDSETRERLALRFTRDVSARSSLAAVEHRVDRWVDGATAELQIGRRDLAGYEIQVEPIDTAARRAVEATRVHPRADRHAGRSESANTS